MMKTRFAPSPTGHIHIGNARTALFSALAAKAAGGTFLLRIEDTDKERSLEEHTTALKKDLYWLHCYWDEGPDIGGEFAPYYQSERGAIYERYYQKLESMGLAYPCFCTEAQLALNRKVQQAAGQPPRYSGTCRALSKEDVAAKLASGLTAALRFHVPDNDSVEFTDLVKGSQRYMTNDIGDFIIRRSDGGASFMFCNAIDDSLMHVTQVLRGDDHLTNTPRQLMILKALNMHTPHYGHLSLILGQDGAPLSKRNGSKSIRELHDEHFFPEAIINYLARLGHYYANNSFMTFEELAAEFAVEHLNTSPARFDPVQMQYWQKQALSLLPAERIWAWMGDEVHNAVSGEDKDIFVDLIRTNVHSPEETLAWATKLFTDYLPPDNVFETISKHIFTVAIAGLKDARDDFHKIANHVKEHANVKGKELFHPLRLALTGETDGPELVKIAQILGAEKIKARFEHAEKNAKG